MIQPTKGEKRILDIPPHARVCNYQPPSHSSPLLFQTTFQNVDRDRSGAIEAAELMTAIQTYGYQLSPRALDIIVKRYSKRSNGVFRGWLLL
jgi:Ca2+-binding EF-hand superfamily protein